MDFKSQYWKIPFFFLKWIYKLNAILIKSLNGFSGQ